MNESEEASTPLEYRSLNALAIFSIVVGVFSILTIFHWLFWLIPLLAMFCGYRAIKQIRRAPTEYTGIEFARSGIAAALVFGIVGLIVQHYIQKYTVPYGYEPITWDTLQPNPKNPSEIIPNSAYDLEPNDQDRDRRVYLTGYINLNTTNRTINIKQFIMVPTVSHCNYCQPDLKSTEMILVNFVGGLSIDATQNEIKLGGKFMIDRDQAANPFGGLPYRIDADCVQE